MQLATVRRAAAGPDAQMHAPLSPTPTESGQPRVLASFGSFAAALDYAALGSAGVNFYSGRGALTEVLPYAALRDQARTTAHRLLALGLVAGDRVAIVADSDADFARVFFGCQYAGLVPAPLPLPAAFGGREAYLDTLFGMLAAAGAAALVMPDAVAGWMDERLDAAGLRFAGTPSALAQIDPGAAQLRAALPDAGPDDLSYLQFSSGSTRFPVGVAITHRAAMANAQAIGRHGLQVRDRGDRCVSWLPLYHDMGLMGFLLTPMACQLSIDLLPTREFARRPFAWLQLISRNRGTLSYSPSFGYELCARRPDAGEALDLSSWRVAGIGGDMIRPAVLVRFAERFAANGFGAAAFVPSYGMAEATLALTFAPLGQGARTDWVDRDRLERDGVAVPPGPAREGRELVLCGAVLPGHRLQIRGPDGAALADRQVGSVHASGPSLMLGYYERAEETAKSIGPDGWLDTGDVGYLLDGQLVVTGRAKDLIIVNGRNIWPQDLEWAAEAAVPSLRSNDVAVVAMETGTDEQVVALVQCRLPGEGDRDALRETLHRLFLGRFGVNVQVRLVSPHALPQTSSGKLTRARARMMLQAGAFGSAAADALAPGGVRPGALPAAALG